jgi:hypothetical protein
MKKIISIVLLLICLAVSQPSWAEERIVQLNLSGCADCDADNRIAKILKKTKGIKKHENKGHGLLIITFDDEKTTLNVILDELKKGKFSPNGDPVYLK